MARTIAVVLVWIALSAGGAGFLAGTPEYLAQIREGSLDTSGAVSVQGLEIDMGFGRLQVLEGVLIPAEPVRGQVFELVFLGRSQFQLEPPNSVESAQLALFTEQESLDTEVDRAVLVLGGSVAVAEILGRGESRELGDAESTEAATLYGEWRDGAERTGFETDAAILAAIHGDRAASQYFAALLHSPSHGRFFYLVDPAELEQVTLGQFIPLEMDDREKIRYRAQISKEKRRGRSLQSRLGDLGDWDTWMRSSLVDAEGQPLRGSSGFESKHYTLEVTVDPKEKSISGTAKIEMTATAPGRRAVKLELFEDLRTKHIRDAAGRELEWFRSAGDVHVLLEEPVESGASTTITVDYSGVALSKIEGGIFSLRDTYSWYPHVGQVDRATYDVEFTWPKGFELLASGRVVESRTEGALRVDRRVLDIQAFAFSFEVGDFKVFREQVGHVELTFAFSKTSMTRNYSISGQEVVAALRESLVYFEGQFGAYPLDHLTVVSVPRGFSQGFLSFITLSHYLIAFPPRGGMVGDRDEKWMETVAHELSHQWWGNKVGWYSYRDQWLSEALASFSAVRFVSQRAMRTSVYLARNSIGWRSSLAGLTERGEMVESLGPVTMGRRLQSSRSHQAYSAIVYDKGALVFSMLARALGEEPFCRMLGALADAVNNRVIDTETFLRSLERMSGLSLQRFADQFIYGTGIPEVYYRYDFREDGSGKWIVEGEAHQMTSSNDRYELSRSKSGWDVKTFREEPDADDVVELVVPFQIVLDTEEQGSDWKIRRRSGFNTGKGLGGNLLMPEAQVSFRYEVHDRPRDFWLDQRGEVLAQFYSETRWPKRTLRYRASLLEGEEAEALLLEALKADLVSEAVIQGQGLKERHIERGGRVEDARIHLRLARNYLDRGIDEAAEAQIDEAEKALGPRYGTWLWAERELLRSRLAIRAGDYEKAFQLMRGNAGLDFLQVQGEPMRDAARRRRWSYRRNGSGEEYAVIAIAAFETGHPEVAAKAMEQAEERRAEMSLLREAR